jgi:proteasome lid subunit RPN8/RPN11
MDGTRIVMDRLLLDSMLSHATSTYPEECCGLMLGRFQDGMSVKKPTSLRKMSNAFEPSERYHRYTIDPKEFLVAEIEAEKNGDDVLGIYHSHPNAPAKPSRFDQDHAWPTLSYVVIEVRARKPANVASWRLKEDRSEFLQEELQVDGEQTLHTEDP